MKSKCIPLRAQRRSWLALLGLCLTIGSAAFAQMAPAPATDAATLAKYDKNKNGRLDPDELAQLQADQAKAAAVTPTSDGSTKTGEDIVTLSPFEVATDTKGYYSSNTMSGTRFNSKIEDLGASISVVTKEQMQDFAMLDINDVFLYTASTEGTGTYTDFTIDRNGSYSDNVELNPQGANRVRGIAAANVMFGNYETMGRSPIDPIAIDGIEISRGPNATISGLGSPAGTVNQVPAAANTTRDRSQVQFRGDSYGGYRTSLDVNRVLLKNKLAFRVSSVFQHDGYIRKPSGTNVERYNGFLKFTPFKNTSITGSFQSYRLNGNRPNAAPPRDQISYWIASGRPTWDPVLQQVHLNGATVGTFTSATGLPDYFLNTFTGSTRGQFFVNNDGSVYWTTPTTNNPLSVPPTPAANGQTSRFVSSSGAAGVALGHITAQPLFTTTPTISDKSIYDWSSVNLSAVNRVVERTYTSNVQIDQIFLNTPRQTLAGQAGFFREDSRNYARNQLGPANQNGQSGQLIVDVNEKLLDGTPNPYFLRPFIGSDEPATTIQPYKWDTYRAQLAYKLDLSHEEGFLKWLGMHELTGYDEYKYRIQRQYRYRDVIYDTHAWAPGANLRVAYYRYYVGDNQGSNVDYAPSDFKYGTYPFVWGGYSSVTAGVPNPASGIFNHEPTQIAQAAQTDNGGGASNSKTILKTVGAVLQSHFLGDRLVSTFGVREDRVYVKFGNTAGLLNPDGNTYNNDAFNHWAAADWRANNGKTKQVGFVLKPFRDLPFLKPLDGQGAGGHFFANLLNGLSLTYNHSDSFTPQTPAQDLFLRPLPNQTGLGKDYGFALRLFDDRFVIRVNRYDDRSINARNGDANTIAQRVLRHDINVVTDPFQLVAQATNWVTALNPTWTTDQINVEVAKEIGLSQDLQATLKNPSPPIAATNDIVSKGTEIEVNFNPTKFWTVSASGTETKSITANVSESVQTWIDMRMPIWTTIVDPRFATDPNPAQRLWWTNTTYGGSQTAAQNFATFVQAPYAVIHAQEGKSKSDVRRYNFRFSTNYRLAGITENHILKNMSVGGALRWEDKGGIGYYGVQKLPAVITDLDPNHPIYDGAHTYVDAFVSYRTRLWHDKVGATFQFNARNIQEGGRLQPTAAFPDGTPSSYRIVDPRQFILSASFDL